MNPLSTFVAHQEPWAQGTDFVPLSRNCFTRSCPSKPRAPVTNQRTTSPRSDDSCDGKGSRAGTLGSSPNYRKRTTVEYRQLAVPRAWEITPKQFGDPRGVFLEWFTSGPFDEAVRRPLNLQPANLSVSVAGVVRGIHFTDVPLGQGKYVMCARGVVLDVVVDIRVAGLRA
jgi:hypothetical protein